MRHRKLTDLQVMAIHNATAAASTFNLATGYPQYTLARQPDVATVVDDCLHNRVVQADAEDRFRQAFFTLAGQPTAARSARTLFCPAASFALDIVANYLRLYAMSASLIEPTFDSLADILKRHRVPLHAVAESELLQRGVDDWLRFLTTDALVLVTPNNPTGHMLSPADWHAIIDWCTTTGTMLIVDCCFRFFDDTQCSWDQYALLEASGIRYIMIEDTGKTWPTGGLKVSAMSADQQTFTGLQTVYRDLLIALSTINLCVVTAYIETMTSEDLNTTVRRLSIRNRQIVRATLVDSWLQPTATQGSLEWARIMTTVTDEALVQHLQQFGIFLLPGRAFFWSRPSSNTRFLRIALMRDEEMVTRAMQRLTQVLPLQPRTPYRRIPTAWGVDQTAVAA